MTAMTIISAFDDLIRIQVHQRMGLDKNARALLIKAERLDYWHFYMRLSMRGFCAPHYDSPAAFKQAVQDCIGDEPLPSEYMK